MFETVFSRELARADSLAVIAGSGGARSSGDFYLWARALLALGRYDDAGEICHQRRRELGDVLGRFLQIQISIYRDEDRQGAPLLLYDMLGKLAEDDFLRAEAHSVLGDLHNLLDEYQQGARHHRIAADEYHRLALYGHEGAALFNLCVAYTHLNERALYPAALERLESLAGAHAIPLLTLVHLRLRARRLVDTEEYAPALSEVERAIALAESTGRGPEWGAMVSLKAFLLLQVGDESTFALWASTINAADPRLSPAHRCALEEYRRIAEVGLLAPGEGRDWVRRWRGLALESHHHLLLLQCLMQKLARAQDYEMLARLAHQAGRLSLERQHALSLVDFRLFEALGLLRLGDHERARVLTNMSLADAQECGAARRVTRANELLNILGRNLPEVQEPGPAPEAIKPTGQAARQRRGQLLRVIRQARAPVTISELDELFHYCRRTLQFDLKYLLQARLIRSTGVTRNRRYFAQIGSELKPNSPSRTPPEHPGSLCRTGH